MMSLNVWEKSQRDVKLLIIPLQHPSHIMHNEASCNPVLKFKGNWRFCAEYNIMKRKAPLYKVLQGVEFKFAT